MRVERITPLLERGRGWARVPFKDCQEPSALASIAIVKPSHFAPFLGRMGWQISESRLPISIKVTAESEFELLLPPVVVQHLEVGNYEFLFFNSRAERIHSVIVRWAGVTYRAPRGEISPIEIIEQDDSPPNQPIFGVDATTQGFPVVAETEGFGPANTATEFGNAWPEVIEPETTPRPTIAASQPPLPPVGTYSRKEVRRIRCLNHSCSAEILDSMSKCPFCGSVC